uniref:Uncharacterized protein n=1 Tax=Rhizophora mucronata TaxID=61149 RepID=A0A2P2PNF4_RHIMU
MLNLAIDIHQILLIIDSNCSYITSVSRDREEKITSIIAENGEFRMGQSKQAYKHVTICVV